MDARNGDVVLAKIDVDEQQELSARFQVASVPQVFAVKEGEIVDQFIGAQVRVLMPGARILVGKLIFQHQPSVSTDSV